MVGGVTLFGFIVAGVGASVVLSQKPHIFRVHSELRPRLQKIGKSHAAAARVGTGVFIKWKESMQTQPQPPRLIQLLVNLFVFPCVIATGMAFAIPAMIATFVSICAGHWYATPTLSIREYDYFNTCCKTTDGSR